MDCNLQEGYFLAGPKRAYSDLCRQEPYVSFAYGIRDVVVLNLS
jgi:hypothetical protein